MSPKFKHVVFCLENWAQEGKIPPVLDGLTLTHRGIYSCTVAFLQYLLPLLVVLIIYAMIYRFLRQQQYPRHLRQNKTNTLLASISLTHCLMWLPFSVFNILADLWGEQVRNFQYIHHDYSKVPNNSAASLFIFKVFSLPTHLIWTYTLIKFQTIFLPKRLLSTKFYFFVYF